MGEKSRHPSAELGDSQVKANPVVSFTSTLRFLVQTRERKHEKNGLVLSFCYLTDITVSDAAFPKLI